MANLPANNGNPTLPPFTRIPLELRFPIYELLLVNPLLGQSESISCNYGADMVYGLSPALLGVNRQVNEEASEWLYGKNTMYMACCPQEPDMWNPYSKACFSPLTRYAHYNCPSDVIGVHGAAQDHRNSMARVRNWTVVVDLPMQPRFGWCPPIGLLQFCRAIIRSSPQSIRLYVIDPSRYDPSVPIPDTYIRKAMSPLWLLRGVSDFEVLPANDSDIPIFSGVFQWPATREFKDVIPEELSLDLASFVMSKEPVECAAEMFDNLLTYAKTIERIPVYEYGMSTSDGEVGSLGRWRDTIQRYNNPYRRKDTEHPVEGGLIKCRLASDGNDLDWFKEGRARVLKYLEPQYQHLSTSARDITTFVKEQQFIGGTLENSLRVQLLAHQNYEISISALALLESFHSAFNKNTPSNIRSRTHLEAYQKKCNTEATELVRITKSALAEKDYHTFTISFGQAVQRLQDDFQVVQDARKKLFEWDVLNQRRCNIGVGPTYSRRQFFEKYTNSSSDPQFNTITTSVLHEELGEPLPRAGKSHFAL